MFEIPECLDPLYSPEGGPSLRITVVGSLESLYALGPLPVLSEFVQWMCVEVSEWCGPNEGLTFVLWSGSEIEHAWALPESGEPTLGMILVRHVDQPVHLTLGGKAVTHLTYSESALAEILRVARMLVLPLLYRSVICLDYLDMAFFLTCGGRLTVSDGMPLNSVVDSHESPLATYFVILVPIRDATDHLLSKLVDALPVNDSKLSLIAAHLYEGDKTVVSVMTLRDQ